jgi:hypothetical protein
MRAHEAAEHASENVGYLNAALETIEALGGLVEGEE